MKTKSRRKRLPTDWIICAAGGGVRFGAHQLPPKPLIQLVGLSMLERSALCLDLCPEDQLIVLTQRSHQVREKLEAKLLALFPWVKLSWIELAHPTSGQLATAMQAAPLFRSRSSVAIWNCDTYFRAPALSTLMSDPKVDGVVPCGKLPGESWSFFRTDASLTLKEAREKVRISEWASVGLYYFRSGQAFKRFALKTLKLPPPPGTREHYVTAIYPALLQQKLRIKVAPTSVFLPFGTPEQVEEYWGLSMAQLTAENTEHERSSP